jgi:5,10-methylenetetrahydromethanopterin reductase
VAIRIGVSFDGFGSTAQTLDLARAAVAAGARSLWMAEHMGYREAAVTSMGLLMATDGAMVVPTAVSPYLWHPMPTAMAMATLAEAGNGRVGIAVGTGNPLFLKESGKEIDKPIRAMREFAECLRALWTGEPVHYDGQFFQLRGARMAFRPPEAIPIYVAAIGEQMLRLSGRIGDGVCLSAGISAAYAKRSIDIMAEGAAAAGRDANAIRRAGYLYLAMSKDGKSSYELVRGKLAFLLRNKFLGENARFTGIEIDQERIIEAISRRDMETAARLVPDEAVEAFAVSGTSADCRKRLDAFIAAGMDEPVMSILGGPEERDMGLAFIREYATN